MAAKIQKSQVLRVPRGSDVLVTAQFDADDTTPTIAGWGIEFAVNEELDGGLPVFSKSIDNGDIVIVSPTPPIVITIAFGFADTNPLAIRTYYFDVWRTDTNEKDRLARGTMLVEQRVVNLT